MVSWKENLIAQDLCVFQRKNNFDEFIKCSKYYWEYASTYLTERNFNSSFYYLGEKIRTIQDYNKN